MMHIERTTDSGLIRAICTHPRIWPAISSDGQLAEHWTPPMHDSVHWLAPVEDGSALGVFMVYPITTICWEVHTCILPEHWGERAAEAAKKLIRYVFENTTCTKLITHVPANNRLALRFAKLAGMKEEWVNGKSILKDGKAMDQTVLAIYKESAPCLQLQ